MAYGLGGLGGGFLLLLLLLFFFPFFGFFDVEGKTNK